MSSGQDFCFKRYFFDNQWEIIDNILKHLFTLLFIAKVDYTRIYSIKDSGATQCRVYCKSGNDEWDVWHEWIEGVEIVMFRKVPTREPLSQRVSSLTETVWGKSLFFHLEQAWRCWYFAFVKMDHANSRLFVPSSSATKTNVVFLALSLVFFLPLWYLRRL